MMVCRHGSSISVVQNLKFHLYPVRAKCHLKPLSNPKVTPFHAQSHAEASTSSTGHSQLLTHFCFPSATVLMSVW